MKETKADQMKINGFAKAAAAAPRRMTITRRIAGRLAAGIAATALSFAAFGGAASAQGIERTAAFEKWAVFVDSAAPEKYCYAATVPAETRASRRTYNRGDAFLLVSVYPAAGNAREVSVRLGFPADSNRAPTMTIGNRTFKMFTVGEDAWLESPDQDSVAIEAMRRGAKAVVTSTSQRGTRITDEFSLIGFTKSFQRTVELCR